MARALIVSSFFPPYNSAGGSIRLVKFIKYMSSLGWEFVVYTRDYSETFTTQNTLSSFLLDELPEGIIVKRIGNPVLFRKISKIFPSVASLIRRVIGESSLGWGINAYIDGSSFMKTTSVDLIFSVTPPFTNALTAMLLGWSGKTPVVLDLKDDWVNSPTFMQKSAIRRYIENCLENLIVRRVSAIVTVTPQSFYLYKKRYSKLPDQEKFSLIPNGCDLEEYGRLKDRERKILTNRFRILSAAWGFKKDYRDITPFFLALDVFLARHPDARQLVEVVLLGDSLSAEYDELLSSLSLNELVICTGALRRNEFVDQLWEADLFLLIQPVGNTSAISGTLYEYWATGKAPVLLISEIGASSKLIEENALGKHFTFRQIEQIADYIEELYNAYRKDQSVWVEREGVENFDRRILAKRMDHIWRKALRKEV